MTVHAAFCRRRPRWTHARPLFTSIGHAAGHRFYGCLAEGESPEGGSRNSNWPLRRRSREDAPTSTSNIPGSATNRLLIGSKNDSEVSSSGSVTLCDWPGASVTLANPFNSLGGCGTPALRSLM